MAQVVVELSADESKLLNSYRKIQTQQNKVDAGHKKMVSGMNKFSKATQQSERRLQSAKSALFGTVGGPAVQQLQQFAVGMIGVSSAVAGLSKVMQVLREDTQQALQVTEELVDTGMKMSQIVQGEQRDEIAVERTRLSNLTGVKAPRIEELQFTAQSTGMSKDAVQMIADAAGSKVFDIEQAAKVGSEVPLLFGGKANAYQSIAGLAVAAQASPADFNTLAENLQTAAEGTNQAGISPEETIAALAVMREKFKPETAAQRINRFSANLAQDERFRGKGLAESVRMLEAMPEADRREFTGESIQMGSAYDALVKLLPRLEERTSVVRKAFADPNAILGQMERAATDPRFEESARMAAYKERQRALRQQENQALLRAGEGSLERQAAAIRMETQAKSAFVDPSQRYARKQFRNVMVDMGVDPSVSQFIEESPQERLSTVFGKLFRVIDDMTGATRENTEAMERNNAPSRAALGVAE